MFFDSSDYNIPPCCSQKYFRFLFEHLRTHSNTTLFVLPDFDLARTIERLLVHMPVSDMTLALPRLDHTVVSQLIAYLHCPCTDIHDGQYDQTHKLVNLNLIIAPPQLKEDPQTRISLLDESPRNDLLATFSEFGTRVHIYEANISTTIIHLKNRSLEFALYGDILQSSTLGTKDTTLRLLHATTDPLVLNELRPVLRMHMHHPAPLPPTATSPSSSPAPVPEG